jgi:hypothetical protein
MVTGTMMAIEDFKMAQKPVTLACAGRLHSRNHLKISD